MSTKELQQELDTLVSSAKKSLHDAEAFANKHGLSFYFEPSYGMGGEYIGGEVGPYDQQGWNPSSQSC